LFDATAGVTVGDAAQFLLNVTVPPGWADFNLRLNGIVGGLLLLFFFWGGGQQPLVPLLLLLDPAFFLIILFLSTTLSTGMTGISLHMHWPLTLQSHGSIIKENNCFFVTDQTPCQEWVTSSFVLH
jgi:hypothetical protein